MTTLSEIPPAAKPKGEPVGGVQAYDYVRLVSIIYPLGVDWRADAVIGNVLLTTATPYMSLGDGQSGEVSLTQTEIEILPGAAQFLPALRQRIMDNWPPPLPPTPQTLPEPSQVPAQ